MQATAQAFTFAARRLLRQGVAAAAEATLERVTLERVSLLPPPAQLLQHSCHGPAGQAAIAGPRACGQDSASACADQPLLTAPVAAARRPGAPESPREGAPGPPPATLPPQQPPETSSADATAAPRGAQPREPAASPQSGRPAPCQRQPGEPPCEHPAGGEAAAAEPPRVPGGGLLVEVHVRLGPDSARGHRLRDILQARPQLHAQYAASLLPLGMCPCMATFSMPWPHHSVTRHVPWEVMCLEACYTCSAGRPQHSMWLGAGSLGRSFGSLRTPHHPGRFGSAAAA